MGRPPIGDRAMTATERQRRHRAERKAEARLRDSPSGFRDKMPVTKLPPSPLQDSGGPADPAVAWFKRESPETLARLLIDADLAKARALAEALNARLQNARPEPPSPPAERASRKPSIPDTWTKAEWRKRLAEVDKPPLGICQAEAVEILASALAAVQPAAVSLSKLATSTRVLNAGDLTRVWWHYVRNKGQRASKARQHAQDHAAMQWLLDWAAEALAAWLVVERRNGDVVASFRPDTGFANLRYKDKPIRRRTVSGVEHAKQTPAE